LVFGFSFPSPNSSGDSSFTPVKRADPRAAKKKLKKVLRCSESREIVISFWGEQQAVVTIVAAACNFYGVRESVK
jgi:hypothetical protein